MIKINADTVRNPAPVIDALVAMAFENGAVSSAGIEMTAAYRAFVGMPIRERIRVLLLEEFRKHGWALADDWGLAASDLVDLLNTEPGGSA